MRLDPLRLAVSRSSRLLVGAAVGVLAAGLVASPALAEDATTPDPTTSETGSSTPNNIGPQTAGTPACTLQAAQDKVVGIVAAGTGYVVVEGHEDPNNIVLFTLDPATCAATATTYNKNPLDIRDIQVGSDGSFYTLDGGDTDHKRASIALEKLPAGGGNGVVFRFVFPGNAKLEANAFLLGPGDLPIFFAAETDGTTGIYTIAAMPPADNTTASTFGQLTKAGSFTATATGTPAGVTNAPNLITAAAESPDGTKGVIRTFSDAYEYEVGAEGIAAALVGGGTPTITPLPNEARGEAITYSADGAQFVTAGFGGGPLLTYTPHVIPELPPPPTDTGATAGDSGGFLGRFSMSELTKIIAAVGVVGLVLAIAGIIGIRRARRRRREEEEYDDYDDYDDEPRRGRGRGGRGRDRGYGRESAYAGAGYDEGYGGGYGGYDQGYGAQGGAYGGQGGDGQGGYGGQGGYDQGYGR